MGKAINKNRYFITKKIKKIIKTIFIYGVFAVFVSGCIELEEKVTLREDGSGTLMRTIITTNPMIMKMLKKESFNLEGMKVHVKNVIKQKKLYHYQWIDFKSISELSIKGEILSLSVKKRGLFEFGKKAATFKHVIAIEEPPKPSGESFEASDESSERYKFILLGMLKDVYFNYILEVPGKIKDVYSLKVGGVEIEPSVKGNLVTWGIPVILLLDAVGKPILVKTDFAGNMKTAGTVISQHGIEKLLTKNEHNKAMTTYKALVKISGKTHPKILSRIKKAQTKQATQTKPSYLYTQPQIANFREEPSLFGNKIGQFKKNTKVEKLSIKGEWFEIKIGDKIGWLHESVVSELPSEKRDKDELIRPAVNNWKLELGRRRGKIKAMNEQKGRPKEVKKGDDEIAVITFNNTKSPAKVAFFPPSELDDFEQFTKAKFKFDERNYREAREDFRQFLKGFPNSKHAQDSRYWFAESYYREGAYKKAIIEYEKMIFKFPRGNRVASALFKQAEAFKKLGDKESAGFLYQKIIKKFPMTSQAGNAKLELNRF